MKLKLFLLCILLQGCSTYTPKLAYYTTFTAEQLQEAEQYVSEVIFESPEFIKSICFARIPTFERSSQPVYGCAVTTSVVTIYIADTLSTTAQERLYAHELGHVRLRAIENDRSGSHEGEFWSTEPTLTQVTINPSLIK